ncbi:PREDICTED: uncharacterized protein LOC107071493 isoform X2 [Polistes dominula]|uniref:Uncharacterized protein LOC107071493 isoform X2 n=1 Tax=Polistes dominula TaxID=743375 RepID=A0ABM1J0N0_POLDO|nr:PREDICTED: uncharacterized protein LOC107071493 isoform X2 [Polistes dominula]
MASRKQLRQERQALESRLSHVENLIKEGNLSKKELGKRYERLTNLVDSYEQLYRKCVDDDIKEGGFDELEQLVERYLAIGDKIDSDDTTAVTSDSNRNNDTMNTCHQQIQFRRIEIPRFDGDMGKWLSFKSNFLTLVDARRDLSDLEKHVYLRDALSGQAFQTIQHYQLTGEYYKAAWGALLTAFDIPRILLARAFDALIDIPRPKTRSAKDITAFLNELRSHISTINSFNNLDALLVRLAERALPLDMLQEWDKQTGSNEYPTIEQFFDFLTRSTRSSTPLQTPPPSATLESCAKRRYPETTTIQPQKRQNTHSTSTSSTRNYCCFCKRDDHALYRCPQFNNMTKLDRLEAVKRHGVCKNCLRKHRDPCKSSFCRVCHHAHHTSLHIDYDKYEIVKLESQSPAKSGFASTSQTKPISLRLTPIFHVNLRCEPNELLMSAICGVKRGDKTFKNCRALLDTCATAHFITENIARDLLLPIKPCSIPINAINDTRTLSAGIIEIRIQSIHCKFYRRNLSLLVVPKIADQVPSEIFPRRIAQIPSDRKLADPQFHLPRPVEILIGSETTLALMSIGPVFWSQARGDFMLQKTELGWVIVGIKSKEPNLNNTFFATTELKEQLEKFWSIEDTNITRSKSVNEIECENHYVQNTKRDESGRYIVRLPFREEGHDYSNMRATALRRLQTHWKRLEATPEIRKEYERIMQEYIDLGHMSMVANDLPGGCYIPHFSVFKSTSMKTEVRIVFAASTKDEKKLSLNSTLLVGPTIQDTQVEHLLRFRTYRYVLTANIEKMYRQIWIHPDDRKYQRIFWFHNKQICTFELNTVTFGLVSAPFLAMRTIKQLAKDEGANYPLGAEILNRDLYVDDLITGADNVETLGKIRDQIIEILKRGGFNMRQWSSNFRPVLKNLDTKNVDVDLCSEDTPILKTIGISWNAHHDRLIYSVTPIDIKEKTTKRRIISEVAKIFDPLGHLSPIILTAKILIQDCWKTHIDWDELVPSALHSSWVTFAEQLTLIDNLTIERRITLDNPIEVQIHGFCGGSQSGYGGCLYIRSRDESDAISVRLLCAKNCVAPLKDTTIPRLELCGALTLARLYREVRIATGLRSDKVTFWSDSMIVLGWLKRDPGTLKIYTANRVREIQEICEGITWRHVQSGNNPADILSRGQLPRDFVMNDSWFYGPSWLKQPEAKWPIPTDKEILKLPDLDAGDGLRPTRIRENCRPRKWRKLNDVS